MFLHENVNKFFNSLVNLKIQPTRFSPLLLCHAHCPDTALTVVYLSVGGWEMAVNVVMDDWGTNWILKGLLSQYDIKVEVWPDIQFSELRATPLSDSHNNGIALPSWRKPFHSI